MRKKKNFIPKVAASNFMSISNRYMHSKTIVEIYGNVYEGKCVKNTKNVKISTLGAIFGGKNPK